MSEIFDAIVAGAGPAGSEIAYHLASQGHRVLVLEKGPLFREKPCGGGIQTQEVIEFGPLDDRVIERRISSARVYASDSQCLDIPPSGPHRGATVRRAVYDAYLQERARAAGAVFLADHPVVGVRGVNGQVTVETRGARPRLRARLLVYAGGAGPSSVKTMVGAARYNPQRLYVAVEKWMKLDEGAVDARIGDAIEIYGGTNVVQGGYGWLFPKRDVVSVGVGTSQGTLLDHGINLRTKLEQFIASHPVVSGKLTGAEEVKFTGGLIPCEPLERLHFPGVIFVGDAGGFGNILHGGGIWQARKSAKLAAHFVDLYLRRGDEKYLAEYEGEVKEHFWEYEGRWDSRISRFIWNDRLLDSTVALATEGRRDLTRAFSILLNSTESHRGAYEIFEHAMLDILHRFLKSTARSRCGPLEDALRRLDFGEGLLSAAAQHVLLADSKRFRATLVLLGCEMYGGDPEEALAAAVAYELLHAASLVHDDVMDGATRRRGREALHRVLGEGAAITAGDAFIFEAYRLLSDGPWSDSLRARLCRLFSEAGAKASCGQAADLSLTRHYDAWSVEAYIRMVRDKTGSLIESPLAAGAMIAGASDDEVVRVRAAGERLGMAFQIVDDSNDFLASEDVTLKSLYGDLRQGKCTVVTARCYEVASEAERETIRQLVGADDDQSAHAFLRIARRHGVMDFVRAECTRHATAAGDHLRGCPHSPARSDLLDIVSAILDWCSLDAEPRDAGR